MVDGKKKGSSYERKKAKQLSTWITEGESEDILWRTASSGGKATVNFDNGKDVNLNHFGDLGFTDMRGLELMKRVSIECKSYQEFSLLDVLKKNKTLSLVQQFWNETREDANKSGRWPVLIMNKNYYPEFIMLHRGIWQNIFDYFDKDEFIFYNEGYIILLETFLEKISHKDFIERVPLRQEG